MEKFIGSIDKIIDKSWIVLRAILTIFLVVMVVVLCCHIFWRYVLNNSLTWSEEFLKGMLVWFGMLSVSVLAVRREHVAIVIFKERMPEKVGKTLDKVVQGIIVVICLVVMIVGIRFTLGTAGRLTPALRVPYSVFYAAIPVSFLFVTVYELRNFLVDLTGIGKHAAVDKPVEDLTGGTGEISL